ncbi:MAG: glycoside hydrolase family 43 protein [Bacteroides sp.]|nr:glycoside hydrolase family 43 protein [Roseburia sp.]MCM1461616.1 glycoside hydrolase family 43 protein [Bacteroides sp.]
MKYTNPILPGFRPDPSICRVGEDFYLVNSSFEYFPAIPLYHSTDLVHWEQLGHVLTRTEQLSLKKGAPNCLGIYAPTIRHANGRFYCIVTNVGGNDNFFVYTDDIRGEWSNPVQLPFKGIDPSLFFDDDGRVYYSGTDDGIFLSEIDITTGAALGERKCVWNGSGANNPEGPHLYKIGGKYYLMIAEGGTEQGHMVTIARSDSVFGEYEACPRNPILTNRGTELPIKAVGHADLVDDAKGNWWAVCLGNRPLGYPFTHNLGRETMLVPFVWEGGWPRFGAGGHVLEETEAPSAGEPTVTGRYVPGSDTRDDFTAGDFPPYWNTIYCPIGEIADRTEEGLLLRGNAFTISDDEPKAILLRRQEHFDFMAEVKLSPLAEDGEAGLTVYMNNRHHYEAAVVRRGGCSVIRLRRQLGTLKAEEGELPIDEEAGEITLRLEGSRDRYGFSVRIGERAFSPLGGGETRYLTTEVGGCFTGNYVGIYASGATARFRDFMYEKRG